MIRKFDKWKKKASMKKQEVNLFRNFKIKKLLYKYNNNNNNNNNILVI